MQIHLSRPGSHREGPYSIEQINHALTARKFSSADYWAWYEGLTSWIPLYSVPGVLEVQMPAEAGDAGYEAQVLSAPSGATPGAARRDEANGVASETPGTDQIPLSTGMPFSALEQIFLLTTGEGQVASKSLVTVTLLQTAIGEDWEVIRQFVPRDVIGNCSALAEIGKGPTPPLLWRAMTAFKPQLLQQAREGVYRICVRTFRLETGELVSAFLFYNKQKLQSK